MMQDVPNLNASQSHGETKSYFPISFRLDPRLQTELDRFKEIQKNPQFLLQILLQMKNQRQMEIVANKRNDNSLVCYICGRLIRTRSMYLHLKAHKGCAYACTIDQCHSVYKSKQSLSKHQLGIHRTSDTKKDGSFRGRRISSADRVENGKKSFICKMCGKCFPSKSRFLEHLRIHTGERPERCRLCYRTFRQKSALRVHLKTCLHVATFPLGLK